MGTTITMTAFLTVAYGVMGFVSVGGYIPQMIAFWKNPLLCLKTPVLTWVLWAAQTVVFHVYALLVNGDRMFILSTGMFMTATLACLAVQLYGRWKVGRRMARGGNVVPLNPTPVSPSPATPSENVA